LLIFFLIKTDLSRSTFLLF